MEEPEVKTGTKFQSPIPIIIQLRNLIFEKKNQIHLRVLLFT